MRSGSLQPVKKRSQKAAFSDIIEPVMKMLKKETEQRQAIEMLCTDMLVPQEHLLRKIDAAVDFTHIYELVEDLYARTTAGQAAIRWCCSSWY